MTKELDMTKYSKLFVSEARESLRVMTHSMLILEKDPKNKEMIDQVFRACHSIKGMAGMMNMKVITDTAHELEDVLSAIREDRIQPTGEAAEAIFSCIDALDAMVLAVESSSPVNEDSELIGQLKAIQSKAPKPPPVK